MNTEIRTISYLSVSQINKFRMDKLAYYSHYIKGDREPRTSAMNFGISFHKALSFYLQQKMLKQNENLKSLLEIFNTTRASEQLRAEKFEGYEESENDTPEKQSKDAEKLLELAIPILAKLKPLAIEEQKQISIDNVPVRMYPDLILQDGTLIDWKTSSTNRGLTKAPTLQLIAYSYAVIEAMPELAVVPAKQILFVRKKEPEVVEQAYQIDDGYRTEFARIAKETWDEIKQRWGVLPTSESTGVDLFDDL